MVIKEIMQHEKHRLEEQLNSMKKNYDRNSFPKGKISFSKNGNTYKFYTITDTERTYIPAKEKELIQKLLQKRYYDQKIESYQKEIHALDLYLRRSPTDPDDLLRNHPSLKKIILNQSPNIINVTDTTAIFSDSPDKEWAQSDYEKSSNHPEKLIIETLKGDLVRSKSESMIADELYRYGIQYRYEEKLIIGNDIFYPDFTTKNKRTGKKYIWEHFGKMDDIRYLDNNYLYKINRYVKAGYIPGINFLATYEDKQNPFYPAKASQIINQYLL